jgi:hypothetical protein
MDNSHPACIIKTIEIARWDILILFKSVGGFAQCLYYVNSLSVGNGVSILIVLLGGKV